MTTENEYLIHRWQLMEMRCELGDKNEDHSCERDVFTRIQCPQCSGFDFNAHYHFEDGIQLMCQSCCTLVTIPD